MGIELKSVTTKIGNAAASKTKNPLSKDKAMEGTATEQSADLVNLTLNAVNIHQAEQSLSLLPVVDGIHVAEITNAINNGDYIVDTYVVAEKIIEFEQSLA